MIDLFQGHEVYGYLGSAFILLSFVMRDLLKLRLINTVGCSFFVVYGIMMNMAWPVIITNTLIILINVYYLFGMRGRGSSRK